MCECYTALAQLLVQNVQINVYVRSCLGRILRFYHKKGGSRMHVGEDLSEPRRWREGARRQQTATRIRDDMHPTSAFKVC